MQKYRLYRSMQHPPHADPQNQLRKATSMVAETTRADVLSHKTMPLVDMRAKLWGSRIKNICLWKQPSSFQAQKSILWVMNNSTAGHSMHFYLLFSLFRWPFCSRCLFAKAEVLYWYWGSLYEINPVFYGGEKFGSTFLRRGYSWLNLWAEAQKSCVTTSSVIKAKSIWKCDAWAGVQLLFDLSGGELFEKCSVIPRWFWFLDVTNLFLATKVVFLLLLGWASQSKLVGVEGNEKHTYF